MRTPSTSRYTLYGLAILAVAALLVTLSVLQYEQVFRPVVPVTLHIDRAGLQLLPGSDVKVRGIVVGEVADITSDGQGATIHLRLDPSQARRLPANVSARLIPKTIFGEKYVDLVLPARPSGRHLDAGSQIPEDRSRSALEIDKALDDLLPLLRTVRPADLNATLSALATALDGQGEKLGRTIEQAGTYLAAFNPHLTTMQHDLAALGRVSSTYDEAAPALLRMLRNLTVTSDTIVSQKTQLSAFLTDVTGTADTMRDLLARNADDIIRVNAVSRPVLAMLARYAPEFPCFFKGYAKLIPRVHSAISKTPGLNHSAHVVIEFVPSYPAYKNPIDLPEFKDDRGPNCYGLPNPPGSLPRIQFKDGTEDDPRFRVSGSGGTSSGASVGGVAFSPSMGSAGTPQERALVNTIVAPSLRMPSRSVPDVADLLWGPLARGSGVRLE